MKTPYNLLLLVVILASAATASLAQLENLKGKHDIKVGVIGIDEKAAYLVDLSRRDKGTNAPYVIYVPEARNIGLVAGKSYSAHTMGSNFIEIEVNGVRVTPKPMFAFGTENDQTWACDFPPSKDDHHWKWSPQLNEKGSHLACVVGSGDPVRWEEAKVSKRDAADARAASKLALCADQPGFSNTTLTVVTAVTPAAGMQWKFDEAPSVVARRLLDDLNRNSRGILFTEASGSVPNLYFDVTLSETNAGTRQDSAWVNVRGLGRVGRLFGEKSGDAPYTDWRQAVDQLSSNMLSWFQNGWHAGGPCRNEDGTLRN